MFIIVALVFCLCGIIFEVIILGVELSSTVVEFDDGSRGWIPIVPNGIKPFINASFSSYKDAEVMCRTYTDLGGFDVRMRKR